MAIELDKIYNMDCLEGMGRMAAGSVDCCITSPPYNFCLRVRGGEYVARRPGETMSKGRAFSKYADQIADAMGMDEYFEWQCRVIDEMLRISRGCVFWNIQLVTGNKVAVLKILGRYAERIRDVLVWDKLTAEPAMHDGVLNSEYELVAAFDHGDCKGRQFRTMNAARGTLSNVIRIGKNRENAHRAAFPLSLAGVLVRNFTETGGGNLRPVHGERDNSRGLRQRGAAFRRLRDRREMVRGGRAEGVCGACAGPSGAGLKAI